MGKTRIPRCVELGAILVALSACSSEGDENAGAAGASADCEGCEYVVRGLRRPSSLKIAAGYLYVEDPPAGEILRLPVTGGESEVVSDGAATYTFAVTDAHLYFLVHDPNGETGFKGIDRIEHQSGARENFTRYEDEGELPLGVLDDKVLLEGRKASGETSLLTLDREGRKSVVREWPASETPTPSCIAVLPDGRLVWCDPEDGIWTAPSLSAEGMHVETGWWAGELEWTSAGLIVASAPLDEHGIYLLGDDGALTLIAWSSDAIGSPRFYTGSGVVWVDGGVRLTDPQGDTRLFADSGGELSTPAETLAVSSEHVFFTGHRNADPWSVYRIGVPR
jgi:hypothetical protein